MAGHLFITQGNLLSLACDAWAMPADRAGLVTEAWTEPLRDLDHPRIAFAGDARVARLGAIPSSGAEVFATDTGSVTGQDPEWFAEAVTEFLSVADQDTDPRKPLHGRASRLFAIPAVGTGAGGGRRHRGEVLAAVLRAVYRVLAREDCDFDVVLVAQRADQYAAAQRVRSLLGDECECWPWMPAELLSELDDLARRAREDRLVLFFGAGVSRGAGHPSWAGLLDELSESLFSAGEHETLEKLDMLDQAKVIERRLARKGDGCLSDRIRERFRGTIVSLQHQLLASLPVSEAATTNYDGLFEQSWRAIDDDVAVIPGDEARQAKRWLLKLHGGIEPGSKIVLTRDDYMRFGEDRSALAGVVQAMLITRHMLFVGFSLTDPNFLRIVHDVRNAVGTADIASGSGVFGTALTPEIPKFVDDLWGGEIAYASFADGDSTESAARRLEIFLDRLAARATRPGGFLLDPTFEALLGPGDSELRDAVRALAGVSTDATRTGAWEEVRRLLVRLGADEETLRPSEPAGLAEKGSQHQLQRYVRDDGVALSRAMAQRVGIPSDATVDWRSPIVGSGFAEYRDGAFLKSVGLDRLAGELGRFWPQRGPVWDGLATVTLPDGTSGVLLVEAKAHPAEIESPASGAGEASRARIGEAMAWTQKQLGMSPNPDRWLGVGYQTTNRLAHLLWLRKHLEGRAWLAHLLFVGDTTYIATTEDEWREAVRRHELALGLPELIPGHAFVPLPVLPG